MVPKRIFPAHSRWFLAGVLAVAVPGSVRAWSPGTGDPDAVQGFSIERSDRRDVLAFYHTVYAASESYASDMGWTGNVGAGVAGTTTLVFKEHVRRRVNFYRALAGLPADIVFDPAKSNQCQACALMSARNDNLSHSPPPNWLSYTPAAAEAAASSNLALGSFGPDAIDGYIRDDGSNNAVVGHRRWILYSRAREMGTGDIPESGSYDSANALWTIGDFKPAPAPQFVAWPNDGFVPAGLVPSRWSLSWPGANFGTATVTMHHGSAAVPVTIISRNDVGYGDNSIVWTPAGLADATTADVSYRVTVSGIAGVGVPSSHSYTVTLFNPQRLGESVEITGPAAPGPTGAAYSFSPIAQADTYELSVSTATAATWIEGAEDSPAPEVAPSISPEYSLRQTSVKRTGQKAFHLALPTFQDQAFTVLRDVIPGPASRLEFHDLGRFASTTSTLAAEVSADGGATWSTVFTRNGVGLSSAQWDSSWRARSLDLSAFAGEIVQVRFILRWNNQPITTGVDPNYGFFIDDITVTNATELVGHHSTLLDADASGFTLDAATAGAPLAVGSTYHLRLRPNVGTHWFPFGDPLVATVRQPSGFETWVLTQFPTLTGGPTADDDFDGLRNGVEYAFGLNPLVPTPHSALPQPVKSGDTLVLSFTPPAEVTGVLFGAESSTDLVRWSPVPDSGSGGVHRFSVDVTARPEAFLRHAVVIQP